MDSSLVNVDVDGSFGAVEGDCRLNKQHSCREAENQRRHSRVILRLIQQTKDIDESTTTVSQESRAKRAACPKKEARQDLTCKTHSVGGRRCSCRP
jgi:hypothetical protein